jgi:succinate dehydrogenase / fumarate reductase, membrane anchor subunit
VRNAFPGLGAWLVQRVSAGYMLLFILFVLVHFLVAPPRSYPGWHGWVMSRPVRISGALFFIAMLAHAWVGLRDVIADYVHQVTLRAGLLVACTLGLAATGAWVMQILWMRQG